MPLNSSLETVEGPMLIASIYVDIYATISLLLAKKQFVIFSWKASFFVSFLFYFLLVLDTSKINKLLQR